MKIILLVEDNEDLRELFASILRGQGYVVREAANGVEALAALDEMMEPPSLVLLDLMMPVMSGLELLKILHETQRLAAVPIVVLSAVADRIRPEGPRAFVRKPPSRELLLQLAREYCD